MHVTVRPSTANETLRYFCCYSGVKQGCPLSPDLFDIFTDDLKTVVKEERDGNAPAQGFPVRIMYKDVLLGKRVLLQMYADDAMVVSTTLQGVQKQPSALHDFCVAQYLTVKVAKTKVMVFEKRLTYAQASAMVARRLRA